MLFFGTCDGGAWIINALAFFGFTDFPVSAENLYAWVWLAISLATELSIGACDSGAWIFVTCAVGACFFVSTFDIGAAFDAVPIAAVCPITAGFACTGVGDTFALLADFSIGTARLVTGICYTCTTDTGRTRRTLDLLAGIDALAIATVAALWAFYAEAGVIFA